MKNLMQAQMNEIAITTVVESSVAQIESSLVCTVGGKQFACQNLSLP